MPVLEIYGLDLYSDTGISSLTSTKNGLSFIGETFTFNGGSATTVSINDDDLIFHDGKTDTGSDQTLSSGITINGDSYSSGDDIELEFSVVDAVGREVYMVRIDGDNVGFAYLNGDAPVPGETFTTVLSRDGDGNPGGSLPGGVSSDTPYTSLACFTAGTNILTDSGQKPVETLCIGDLVETMDHGLQPVRWIGSRKVKALGAFAPVVFEKGACGNSQRLAVSQQHRMLLRSSLLQLYFAEIEVFSSAGSLVNGTTIRLRQGGIVEYFHIMFDQHEVIYSEGAPTESFHPGQCALNGLHDAAKSELLTIFPELQKSLPNYSQTARRCLKSFETKLLVDKQNCLVFE